MGCDSEASGISSVSAPAPCGRTLRNINHGLEHQRNGHDKDHVVNIEFEGGPSGRRGAVGDGVGAGILRGARSRVFSSDLDGDVGGDGEARVQSIERVQPPQPGKE